MKLDRQKLGAGLGVSVGLAIALAWLWIGKAPEAALVLRLQTEGQPSHVLDCLLSRDGERLFGALSQLPVGRRSGPWPWLVMTDRGQWITGGSHSGSTLIQVHGRGPLSRDQIGFLRGCADPRAEW